MKTNEQKKKTVLSKFMIVVLGHIHSHRGRGLDTPVTSLEEDDM